MATPKRNPVASRGAFSDRCWIQFLLFEQVQSVRDCLARFPNWWTRPELQMEDGCEISTQRIGKAYRGHRRAQRGDHDQELGCGALHNGLHTQVASQDTRVLRSSL